MNTSIASADEIGVLPNPKVEFFQSRYEVLKEVVQRRAKPLSKPISALVKKKTPELSALIINKAEKPLKTDHAEETNDSTVDPEFNTEIISPMMHRAIRENVGRGFRVAEDGILTPAERAQVAKELNILRTKELFLPKNDQSRKAGWLVVVVAQQ